MEKSRRKVSTKKESLTENFLGIIGLESEQDVETALRAAGHTVRKDSKISFEEIMTDSKGKVQPR